ncbi:hypothetical protein [Streptomyces sp. ODS28]|uniref:hypothetical protein n=1 Tax=Streptomyces sp. ODS28 TaxID=3136688 RepID=UPI0031E9FF61
MHYRITAPVGCTGLVAGVSFANGCGTLCHPHPPMGAIEFLRRHGYTVVAVDPDPCLDEGEVLVVDDAPPVTKTTRTRRNKATGEATTTTTSTTTEDG